MRVITGSAKGRRLLSIGKLQIRPTIDKVKGAIFNVLGSKIKDSSFLDLFAGTGAVGIEALSRGARKIVFVEINKNTLKLIRGNLDHCGFTDKSKIEIIQADAERAIESFHREEKKFDFIFLDPPYLSHLSGDILSAINRFPIITSSGQIIAEHFFKRPPPDKAGCIMLFRRIRYGDASLSYYARNSSQVPQGIRG